MHAFFSILDDDRCQEKGIINDTATSDVHALHMYVSKYLSKNRKTYIFSKYIMNWFCEFFGYNFK